MLNERDKNIVNMVERIAGECETPQEIAVVLAGEIDAYDIYTHMIDYTDYECIEMYKEAVIMDNKDFAVVGEVVFPNDTKKHYIGIRGGVQENGTYYARYLTYTKL